MKRLKIVKTVAKEEEPTVDGKRGQVALGLAFFSAGQELLGVVGTTLGSTVTWFDSERSTMDPG